MLQQTPVNVEEQIKRVLANFGAIPTSPDHAKNYAKVVKNTNTTNIAMGDAENGSTTTSKCLNIGKSSILHRPEQNSNVSSNWPNRWKKLKLIKAEAKIDQQLQELRAYQRNKMSGGHCVDTFQTAVRRAVTTQEKTREQLADFAAKMKKQELKLEKAKQEKLQAQEALKQTKCKMVKDKGSKEFTGMVLTAEFAAFATALLPKNLPWEVATSVHIKINQMFA